MSGYVIRYPAGRIYPDAAGYQESDAIDDFVPADRRDAAILQYGGERDLAEANLASVSEQWGAVTLHLRLNGEEIATAEHGIVIRKENEARLVSSEDMAATPDPGPYEVGAETRTPDELRRAAYRLLKLADRVEWAEREHGTDSVEARREREREDMMEAHAEGMHDGLPRCPECER